MNKGFQMFADRVFFVFAFAVIYLTPHQPLAAAESPVVGQLVDAVNLVGAEDIYLDGDYAYIPCRQGQRLTICSIKDPAHPRVVSSFSHSLLGAASGFDRNGNTIYVTSMNTSQLLVLDATDKTSLRLLGSVAIGGKGRLYKLAYRNGYCFIPNADLRKLFVVDVRNPQDPKVVGSATVTTGADEPFSVLLRGDFALVGTIRGTQSRLAVIDISNPAQPRLTTQVFGPEIGHVSGQVVDELYYSVNWDKNAFLIFDVADAGNPKLYAKLVDKQLGAPNRCVVAGDRAYLPMVDGNGIAVVDISDPEKPQFLTSVRDNVLMQRTYGAAVRDHLLYVASRDGSSLVIIDRNKIEKK
tara:strand:+ start:18326 stop:19387 length:1062 start_codon:yes stop_codon:yes gene_type:complete